MMQMIRVKFSIVCTYPQTTYTALIFQERYTEQSRAASVAENKRACRGNGKTDSEIKACEK